MSYLSITDCCNKREIKSPSYTFSCFRIGWFTRIKYVLLPENKLLYLILKGRNIVCDGNTSIKKEIFPFLNARVWVPILVYQNENPSRYITGHLTFFSGSKPQGGSKLFDNMPIQIS